MEYFDAAIKYTSTTLFLRSTERAEQVARNFSDKGLYYFDANDGSRYGICTLHEYYTKHSAPQKPLSYSGLPEHIIM